MSKRGENGAKCARSAADCDSGDSDGCAHIDSRVGRQRHGVSQSLGGSVGARDCVDSAGLLGNGGNGADKRKVTMIRGCGGLDVSARRVHGGLGDCAGGSDSLCDGADHVIATGQRARQGRAGGLHGVIAVEGSDGHSDGDGPASAARLGGAERRRWSTF